MEVRPFDISDTEAVIGLWRECNLVVPWNDPYKDIRRKLQVRETNHEIIAFYEAMGYRVDNSVALGKRLERDD